MVEAKCIEVDNKQATLAQADHGTQPKLNNEQWQAVFALQAGALHEHHDLFLSSQHPSVCPSETLARSNSCSITRSHFFVVTPFNSTRKSILAGFEPVGTLDVTCNLATWDEARTIQQES
jgi:hypothetical protein